MLQLHTKMPWITSRKIISMGGRWKALWGNATDRCLVLPWLLHIMSAVFGNMQINTITKGGTQHRLRVCLSHIRRVNGPWRGRRTKRVNWDCSAFCSWIKWNSLVRMAEHSSYRQRDNNANFWFNLQTRHTELYASSSNGHPLYSLYSVSSPCLIEFGIC